MFKFLSFVLTFFISSTLVFAQHTIGHYTSQNINQLEIQTENVNACSEVNKNKILRKLDRKIKRAQRKNENLDVSIAKVLKKYDKFRNKQIRKTKRVLKSERKTNKLYQKMVATSPELSKEDMVLKLKDSLSETQTFEAKQNIEIELLTAGSYVDFLKDARSKVEACDFKSLENGETWYLILLIIFLGTPILALLAALVVLIIGLFPLALGLSIYAVSMLAIFFVISNVNSSSLTSPMPAHLLKLNNEDLL